MRADRREPLARYVLFADTATQKRFIERAEAVHQELLTADRWGAVVAVPIGPDRTVTARRGLLRRSNEVTVSAPTAPVTPALAGAARIGAEAPARVASRAAERGGCAAEEVVATAMGQVVLDLVRDLAPLQPLHQRDHPAYGQTLRLTAELQALDDILAEVGCTAPSGCVVVRAADHWGKRAEDIEIAEVRAVLVQLAEKAVAAQE